MKPKHVPGVRNGVAVAFLRTQENGVVLGTAVFRCALSKNTPIGADRYRYTSHVACLSSVVGESWSGLP